MHHHKVIGLFTPHTRPGMFDSRLQERDAVDFNEMAKAAQAKSQSILDAEAEKARAKEEATERRLKAAENALNETVMPILERAQSAFKANGIELRMHSGKSWRMIRGENTPIWAVSFSCHAPVENGKFGQKEIGGQQYHFEHDGTSLTWKNNRSDHYGQKFIDGGAVEEFVGPVVRQALDSYYDKCRAGY